VLMASVSGDKNVLDGHGHGHGHGIFILATHPDGFYASYAWGAYLRNLELTTKKLRPYRLCRSYGVVKWPGNNVCNFVSIHVCLSGGVS
jgi:hypothetical protein